MTIALLRPSLALALGTALAAQGTLAQPQSLEAGLPAASTYAVVHFGGLGACRTAATSLPIAALVQRFLAALPAATRQQHVEDQLGRLARGMEQPLMHVGIAAADLRSVLGCPMVLAAGRVTVQGLGPSLALVVDEGNAGPALDRLLAALAAMVQRQHDGALVESVDVDGIAARVLHVPEGPPILSAHVGGRFVLTNSRAYLREIAAVAAGRVVGLTNGSALGASPRMPQPVLASMFVNTAPLVAAMSPLLPYEAADIGRALGIEDLRGLYAAAGADATGDAEVLDLAMPGDRHGLCKALFATPVDLAFAGMCPADMIAFGALGCDLDAVGGAVEAVLAQMPDGFVEGARRGTEQAWRQMLRQLGSGPGDYVALRDVLGKQVSFAVGLGSGGVPKPEVMVHVAVRDAAHVHQMLTAIEGHIAERGVTWASRQQGDHEIRYAQFEGGDQAVLTPCYTVLDGGVVIASNVALLVRTVKQFGSPDQSLAATDDFRAAAADAKGGVGFLHVRWFRGVELAWRTIETHVYNYVDSHADELGFDRDALPEAEELARAVGTSTMILHVDDAGMRVTSRGPIGTGSAVAAGGMLLDELLQRTGSQTGNSGDTNPRVY